MTKPKGRTMLVYIGDGASENEGFAVLCGLNSKSLNINNTEYDVTTSDCENPGGALWTEVQNGMKRLSVTGNGLIESSAAEARLNAVAMSADAEANLRIIVPGIGTFSGAFHFATVDYGGEQVGGVTYSLSLNSSGVVAFVAAA